MKLEIKSKLNNSFILQQEREKKEKRKVEKLESKHRSVLHICDVNKKRENKMLSIPSQKAMFEDEVTSHAPLDKHANNSF